MSEVNYQILREVAERAMHDDWGYDVDVFNEIVTPRVVLALLDEIKNMQDQALGDGCRIAELEEALRDKQALIPDEFDTTAQQFESLAKSE